MSWFARTDRRSLLLFAGGAFFSFSFSLFLFSLPQRVVAEASSPVHASTVTIRPLEIHIANNGLILLRSARIVAVHGTTLTVSTNWGSTDLRWTVRTDASTYDTHGFGTRFVDRVGKKLSLDDVHQDGNVTVTGTLDPTAQEPTLDAGAVVILN